MRGSHPDKTRSVVSFPDVIPSRTSPAVPEILLGNAQHLFGAELLHDAADWGLTSPMATFSAHTASPPPRIQIFAEHGTVGFEQDGYLLRPAPGVPRSIHRGSYWVPKGSNTIEAVFFGRLDSVACSCA
jgi:hypothetical protein